MRFLQSVRNAWKNVDPSADGRTHELRTAYLRQVQQRTDRLFYYLLLIQYPAAVLVALIWSPLAWSGTSSSVHFHVWFALLFGGLLTSLPIYLIRTCPTDPLTRHVVAVSQMLMGSLLIHLTGGRVETHFHVFGSLAFLAFYRDLPVLVTASVVVVLDHMIRGIFFPESIYGILGGANWRFLEHTFWVVFEDIFLALSCTQGTAQLTSMASQQAQLEAVNEKIEEAVQVRTRELASKTEELATARDAAMESTRVKSQFLANVSHEIRTPMNGVIGMTALLMDTSLTPEQRDYAGTVQRSAESLLSIINDILDFSKMEAGKLVLERLDFLLWNEVEDVVELFIESAERKHIELVCDIDPATPVLVNGDGGRVRQVLVNLAGNAVKFTKQGEVTLRVFVKGAADGLSRVRFEVTDTGIGIPEHAQKHLFEAFVQVDGSTTRKHEGTGLGLAISKQLVQLMGGEIGVESRVGVGSTFWFEIPLQVVQQSGVEHIQKHALKDLRVLIVDDNATNRRVLLKTFEAWGIRAGEAADGPEALKMLASAAERGIPYNLGALDFQMPEMDGIQVARAIRQQAGLQSTQLLLLTSLGQRAICQSLINAGIAACMVKPVRREHLFLMIAKLCGRTVIEQDRDQQKPADLIVCAPKQLSILIAEDNLVNQRVLAGLVGRLGHRHDVVADGEAAVKAVKRFEYDVVLMDCQMPRMDGFEATAAIRQLPGAAGQVPIIAVTANAMSGDRERCLAAGMNGYITKPFGISEVADALHPYAAEAASVVAS